VHSDGLQICIHRGTNQIGGSCVELLYAGKRIVVDLGLPLDAKLEAADLPDIPSIHSDDGSLVGLLLSHGHRDHWDCSQSYLRPSTYTSAVRRWPS
jgi:ribonuclease J